MSRTKDIDITLRENFNSVRFHEKMKFDKDDFNDVVKHFYNSTNKYETRYRSWEHCYRYFKELHKKIKKKGSAILTPEALDDACVRLGFYMASWGMYRGSSFLLQNDYKIYSGIIPILLDPTYDLLWDLDDLLKISPINVIIKCTYLINGLIHRIKNILHPYRDHFIRKSYFTHTVQTKASDVSKTLVTKLLLGTIGCYPAIDTYFSNAIGSCGNTLDVKRIECVLKLAYYIKKESFTTIPDYPVMKLIDMYYFTKGLEKGFYDMLKNDIKEIRNDSKKRKLARQFIIYDERTGGYTANVSKVSALKEGENEKIKEIANDSELKKSIPEDIKKSDDTDGD